MSKRGWLGLCLVAVLAGCSSQVEKPEEAVQAKPVPRETPAEIRARRISILLRQAERALARDRLLLPQYDNAYDHYASVLAIAPDNQAAKLGMQAIVLRYLDMARDAAQRSRFSEADTYLDRAAQVVPDDPKVQQLVAEQRKQTSVRPEAHAPSEASVELDEADIRHKSAALKNQLAALAERARSTDSMVLIVAGNDAQGRWIYQTMRDAVKGYLLRGDIRIGGPSRVEFLAPP